MGEENPLDDLEMLSPDDDLMVDEPVNPEDQYDDEARE